MTDLTAAGDSELPTARRESARSAVLWWELRRIPYNLALAVAGMISVSAVYGVFGPLAPPGEDPIEPIALFGLVALYAVCANLAYTIGWISELLWSGGDSSTTRPRRSTLFRLGLAGSIVLTLLPALVSVLAWPFIKGR